MIDTLDVIRNIKKIYASDNIVNSLVNMEKVMDDVIRFILGDRRDGIDRRVKKSKRKRTRRKVNRRDG